MMYCSKLFEKTANVFMFPRVSIASLLVLREKRLNANKKIKQKFLKVLSWLKRPAVTRGICF